MQILNYISQIIFFAGVALVIGMRLTRNQSATLVLQKFNLALIPEVTPSPAVEIIGRVQGIVAFVLSSMGFSPITKFTIAGPEVRYQTSSLFGQRSQFIPLRCVTTLTAGIHKPIANLIWAMLAVSFGCYLSATRESWGPLAISLVVAIVLVVFYAITKKFFIEVYSQGGPSISLIFKPNVLEGVPIDVDQALEVVGVIRDLILLERAGARTGPQAHPVSDDSEVDQDDEAYNVEAEEEIPEDDERQAQHWYAQARQYSNSGQSRLAIATLQQLVRRFPNTTTADQARRSLAKTGHS